MKPGLAFRAVAAWCAMIVALVAGGSVWCQPLCAPLDAAVPSCHAAASEAPALAVAHDCSSHSLAAFTLETTSRLERAATALVFLVPDAQASSIARAIVLTSADDSGPPLSPPRHSIRILRI